MKYKSVAPRRASACVGNTRDDSYYLLWRKVRAMEASAFHSAITQLPRQQQQQLRYLRSINFMTQ